MHNELAITHKHHIIPKHMGGTDDASNLIELTVEEHAEAHKKLYEETGNEFDLIAYRGLSGQITMSEAARLAKLEGARKGGAIARANRTARGDTIGKWSKESGHVYTIATEEGMKKGGAKVGKMLVETGRFEQIRLQGSKVSGKKMMPILNSKRWKCLECGLESTTGGMGNHQKAKGHEGKELLCLR